MAKKTKRDDELSKRPKIREELLKAFQDAEKGFTDQSERADNNTDYWDCYNCQLTDRQYYSGQSAIFVPLVRNAIEARKTRFCNQIFPQNGRYVDVITENDEMPHATMALLDHYVRCAKLRTQIIPALCVAGDVEGQYSLYISWRKSKRHTVQRVEKPVQIAGMDMPELGSVETMKDETIEVGHPAVEVLADADLLIMPATVDSLEEAIEIGGAVVVMRRWTKAQIRQMIEDGEFDEEAGEHLLDAMGDKKTPPRRTDTRKELADAAGIKVGSGGKYVLGYEMWKKLKVDKEYRLTRSYYGGESIILGCKLNPYWCDKVPILSGPVKKAPGVFKGISPTASVIDMQVLANDACNEGADTAHYSAMPITMTDPEKNPKFGTMVLSLAAVWETSPKDTSFVNFPPLWKDSFEIIQQCRQQIFETLAVNPSMIAQSTASKKQNQAEIANAQQIDILTTADAVTNLEEMILTPLLHWFAELDHQFREDELLIKTFGEMGVRAQMEEIPLQQINRRYEFKWFGVEASRNVAQTQQQIAMMNVLKGIPPQLYKGYELKLSPLITQLVENAYGPRLAPLVFEDQKKQLSADPELENQLLAQRFTVMVHPMDDDIKHLQAHMPLAQNDPSGNVRDHILKHQTQMQMKAMAAQQQMQGGTPGSPGQPGAPGTPSGAQPGNSRMKGPPGMINQDRLSGAGAVVMPRKT